jgi:hypothetical protein
MHGFLLAVLKNLIVAALMAMVSALLYRPKDPDSPEPQDNDFSPTAKEGTELKHLFGAYPVDFIVVAVMDKQVSAIKSD